MLILFDHFLQVARLFDFSAPSFYCPISCLFACTALRPILEPFLCYLAASWELPSVPYWTGKIIWSSCSLNLRPPHDELGRLIGSSSSSLSESWPYLLIIGGGTSFPSSVSSVASEPLMLLIWYSSFQSDLIVIYFGDFVVWLLDLAALRLNVLWCFPFLHCQAVFEVLPHAASMLLS